ncbi:MAG: gamma-glutamyltransferase [Pseudomonadota bacterium]
MTYNSAQPYHSQRSPVAAGNLVATSQPLAVQAGLDALKRGGNAADAAIAAAITLTIVEPTGNGIGADAFALIWENGKLHGLNASGHSPAAWTPEHFKNYKAMPIFGWDTVTVPGAVSAWQCVSEKFGRLPFSELFHAAVDYAERGFPVGPITAKLWQNVEQECAQQTGFAEHFLPAPKAGERFVRADAARSLTKIAESNGRAFYQGELAEQIVVIAEKDEARLALDDLATHKSEWVSPIDINYRDATVHQIPPNGQGLAVLIGLGILDRLEVGRSFSADSVHYQIEAMKVALRAAADHIAHPTHDPLDLGDSASPLFADRDVTG